MGYEETPEPERAFADRADRGVHDHDDPDEHGGAAGAVERPARKGARLRWALHEIRTAIDKYKDMSDQGTRSPRKLGTDGYPETLEVLVEGVKIAGTGG